MAKFLEQLLFWRACKKEGLGLWRCPTFLFIVMGVLTIIAVLATFFVGRQAGDPKLLVMFVFGVAVVIFTPGSIIVRSFERMAELNRIKTEFISIASHQLRSPLSSVKWALEYLRDEKNSKNLNEKQKEYLNILSQGNREMIKLVNDLLNTSRIDKGELPLKNEGVELKGIVQRVIDELRYQAESKNVALTFKVKEKDKFNIKGDPSYLRMAASNLVENAIKYTTEGGEVSVELKKKEDKAELKVKDTGVGIPKKDQKHIFTRFFRADNVKKYQTFGTGLGLFITKSIVDRHGGSIKFKSKKNKGTTFWVTLPLKN